MKRINKALATIFSLSLLLLFVPSRGMGYAMHARPDDNPPAAPADTDSLSEPKQYGLIQAGIHLLARSYGDSIVLRWGAEDYVTQRTLDDVGVMVVRYDYSPEASDPFCDTLVTNLRPWTLEQFEAAYAKEDSMARMAMGIMYSKSGMRPPERPRHGTGRRHSIGAGLFEAEHPSKQRLAAVNRSPRPASRKTGRRPSAAGHDGLSAGRPSLAAGRPPSDTERKRQNPVARFFFQRT